MKHRFIPKLRHNWQHIFFALRATTAAITAIAVAELLQLECPYWAALTALIVIQPTRGLIFEKSVYRLVGTGIGSLGGLIILLNFETPLGLTLVLALWLAACIAISSLFHGLRSYGCVMAGITCAIITMSGSLRGELYEMAFARVACIIIGITVATLMTAFITPKRSLTEVTRRLDQLGTDILIWLASLFNSIPDANRDQIEHQLLIDIVEVEGFLDVAIAGTFHARQELADTTAMLSELMNLLGIGCLIRQQKLTELWELGPHSATRKLFAKKLEQLVASANSDQARFYLNDLHEISERLGNEHPSLKLSLDEILTSLHHILYQRQVLHLKHNRQLAFNRHHDWREGLRSALRAIIMISCAGVFWQLTGWHLTPLLVMTLSIMLTLFASKEHPSQLLKHILAGAILGASTAIICRMVFLHGISGATPEYLVMVPFLIIGCWGMTQKRTAIAATDATFIFLLTLQPGLTTELLPFDMIFGALAMLAGISCSLLAYRYLFPINPAIRMTRLLDSLSKDIRILALNRNAATIARVEAQLRHKVLQLVTLARHQRSRYHSFIDGGLIALSVISSFQQLRKQFDSLPVSEEARHIMRRALSTIAKPQSDHTDVIDLLQEIISTKPKMTAEDQQITAEHEISSSLLTAAHLLSDNLNFLASGQR